jgi:16S rRNA (cytosine1402-N4)-methyltransferase
MQPGGVVVTLAYHSGEDRKIKQVLRARPHAARRLPVTDAVTAPMPWEELIRRVVKPSESEVARNPRARSARLRAFRRKTA